MAIKKQYLKNKSNCKVTFSIAAKDADNVSVIGDFNDWDSKTHPLKKLKNGKYEAFKTPFLRYSLLLSLSS